MSGQKRKYVSEWKLYIHSPFNSMSKTLVFADLDRFLG